ncbi:high affinity cAMP-specific 3',5'-cyclic phosphodiesterase 7A-like isoform X3 [Sipha flava]|uniref:Phosphodiesterase n=2 Tax=Sipha flava TaxID=143950 RepID=A0A8B8GIB4_9HEMI|nr:high affinity cAMP-specific 3',5'-cyclic phosphodiesterase 7A-like isoform X3 [Sipha flava]XP_025422332.1 high affinity cAMP-specific 3',5'-cyclic phosphodiesterase 7A-like isoform X3 [Sipha flava]
MHFIKMVPKLPLDIIVPQYALRRRGAICVSVFAHELFEVTADPTNVSPHSPDVIYIRLRDDSPTDDRCRRRSRLLSEGEVVLLESVAHSGKRLPNGRFLTMHKRRRKKLTTRSLSNENAPALLDDIHHGQVQCVLKHVWKWPFNAFALDTATGGRSLPVLCVHLFHWYGLMEHFKLDVVQVWKLFSLIEEGYHSTNPYHNAIHATDVTQAMHCFLQEDKIKNFLTPLEIMASLIAAVAHDLDHPGVNQPFLIATSNHLATLYENTSVLENHHWRSAVGCLLESHVAEKLSPIRQDLESQISSLILATDITRQPEFLKKFNDYLENDELDMKDPELRHFILQIALKCADISNPCRPWDVSRKWSLKVCDEFFRQGDYERQLGLPVTDICDRYNNTVPKIQTVFFKFMVLPLFNLWHKFLDTKLSHSMMENLTKNQQQWEELRQRENYEEQLTDVSEASDRAVVAADADDMQPEPELVDGLPNRRGSLPAVMLETVDKMGRRHSVPLNLSRATATQVPSMDTKLRRDSLGATMLPPSTLLVQVENRRRFTLGQIPYLEEEEEGLSLSLGSSRSSGLQRSSDGGGGGGSHKDDRPVSAENLIPEPSIATITNPAEASRLCNVIHGVTSPVLQQAARSLTRQQTFPPIQPYVRARYLSTGGGSDLVPCSSSSGGTSAVSTASSRTGSTSSEGGGGAGDGGCVVLVGNGNGTKRDSVLDADRAYKLARFSKEKENVDPASRTNAEIRRNSNHVNQILTKRRGSAPVSGGNGDSTVFIMPGKGHEATIPRRGSVPSDFSKQSTFFKMVAIGPLSTNGRKQGARRSSLPYDSNIGLLSSPLVSPSRPERRGSDSSRPSSRRRRRKSMKRRSSGGSDVLLSTGQSMDSFLAHRRGSLPVEILATSFSGPH